MATLAELREGKAKREAARQLELDALEVEKLGLEEKYEAEGKRLGVDFEVVTTMVGNFVVNKPDFIAAKQFAAKDKPSVEDVTAFVLPSVVFPDRATMGAVFLEHGGIAYRLSVSLMHMYEAKAEDRAGK